MDDADDEDGTAIVAKGEGVGFGSVGVDESADAPGGVACAGDEECDAAAGDDVAVRAWFAAEGTDQNVNGEDDEGGSDEALADGVHVVWE